MALPQEERPVETVVELRGPDTLDEDLGSFGRWVGPRYDAVAGSRTRARSRLGEHWCLRRLLIGLALADRLTFPVTLRISEPDGGARGNMLPDAVLSRGDATDLGIQVTEATSESGQRYLHALDKEAARDDAVDAAEAVSDPGDGQVGDAPERQAVREVEDAYRRKTAKLVTGSYDRAPEVDLLIYLNSEAAVHVDPTDIVSRVRSAVRPHHGEVRFRRIHLLFDDSVVLDVFGETTRAIRLKGRYEHDFRQWCADQAERLRTGDVAGLDFRNLAEELRSLGGSDERGRDSQIRRLLHHLLKWHYQPEKRSVSWAVTISNARVELEELIDFSPSLGRPDELQKAVDKEYPRAVRLACQETGLKRAGFPERCPYTLRQIFDPDYPDDLTNQG